MKALYCILIALVFSACSSKEIYYQCNGVTVTRVDRNGEICLYYGDSKENRKKQPFVKAKYSGFNSGVDAYLVFHEDATVEVIGFMGFFSEGSNGSKSIYRKRYGNGVLDSVLSSYKNKIRISDVIDLEKEDNLNNDSEIRAIYP